MLFLQLDYIRNYRCDYIIASRDCIHTCGVIILKPLIRNITINYPKFTLDFYLSIYYNALVTYAEMAELV